MHQEGLVFIENNHFARFLEEISTINNGLRGLRIFPCLVGVPLVGCGDCPDMTHGNLWVKFSADE